MKRWFLDNMKGIEMILLFQTTQILQRLPQQFFAFTTKDGKVTCPHFTHLSFQLSWLKIFSLNKYNSFIRVHINQHEDDKNCRFHLMIIFVPLLHCVCSKLTLPYLKKTKYISLGHVMIIHQLYKSTYFVFQVYPLY